MFLAHFIARPIEEWFGTWEPGAVGQLHLQEEPPLFPGVPALSVVIYVVKNASRPVSGEHSPMPDGKRFAFLCGVYCNSE